jgi:hypothetical protein
MKVRFPMGFRESNSDTRKVQIFDTTFSIKKSKRRNQELFAISAANIEHSFTTVSFPCVVVVHRSLIGRHAFALAEPSKAFYHHHSYLWLVNSHFAPFCSLLFGVLLFTFRLILVRQFFRTKESRNCRSTWEYY